MHTIQTTILDTPDDAAIIRSDQFITDEFLEHNRQLRDLSDHRPMGNNHKFASVPVAVIEQWMREGFNVYDPNITVKEVVARLQKDNMTAFLTSNKRL